VISTAEFYGGAVDIGTGAADYYHKTGRTVRVIRASWATGSHDITLPKTLADLSSMPLIAGAPYNYLINDGAASFDVKYIGPGGGTITLGTVATNKVMIVFTVVTDTSGTSPDGNYYAVIVDKGT